MLAVSTCVISATLEIMGVGSEICSNRFLKCLSPVITIVRSLLIISLTMFVE